MHIDSHDFILGHYFGCKTRLGFQCQTSLRLKVLVKGGLSLMSHSALIGNLLLLSVLTKKSNIFSNEILFSLTFFLTLNFLGINRYFF